MFFRHGSVDIDTDLKCAETYLVLSRDTTQHERARIEAHCPRALCAFSWAERFAYFGSDGDMFELEVLREFGGAKVAELVEANDWQSVTQLLPMAMNAFTAAADAWLEEVHAIVPIAFTEAAAGTVEDAWAKWSESHIDEALAVVIDIVNAHPWLDGGPASDARPDRPGAGARADRARAMQCFGWIRDRLDSIAPVVKKRGKPASKPASKPVTKAAETKPKKKARS